VQGSLGQGEDAAPLPARRGPDIKSGDELSGTGTTSRYLNSRRLSGIGALCRKVSGRESVVPNLPARRRSDRSPNSCILTKCQKRLRQRRKSQKWSILRARSAHGLASASGAGNWLGTDGRPPSRRRDGATGASARRKHKAAGRLHNKAVPDRRPAQGSISADYANYRAHSARPARSPAEGNAPATRGGGGCLAIPPSLRGIGRAGGASRPLTHVPHHVARLFRISRPPAPAHQELEVDFDCGAAKT
jgi:hypothetical protein